MGMGRYSLHEAATTITLHMMGMFLPGFVTGNVIDALGGHSHSMVRVRREGLSVLEGAGLTAVACREAECDPGGAEHLWFVHGDGTHGHTGKKHR